MTLVYVVAIVMVAYLIGLGIGIVKKNNEKYEVIDFLIGYSIVIIFSLIYLIIN
jgi:hypothetical protein